MRDKLNCILLIDDDEATNFIHSMVISQLNCTKNIVTKENGVEALDYLRSINEQTEKHPQPDLILLDINMPGMNGWEFLEEYKKLNDNQLAKTVIVMLTTSLNPDDKEKTNHITDIRGFMHKPLTKDMMNQVLDDHF